jgi:hypothetical protein
MRFIKALTSYARLCETAHINPTSCKSDVGIFLWQYERCSKIIQKDLEKLSITDKVYNQNKLTIEI